MHRQGERRIRTFALGAAALLVLEAACWSPCIPGEPGLDSGAGCDGEEQAEPPPTPVDAPVTPTPWEATPTPVDAPVTPTPQPEPAMVASLSPNPACVLSCIVRWQTLEPATSWVTFGEGNQATQRIGSDVLTLDHEVVVVGMHASSTYLVQAVSETEAGRVLWSQPMTFETGALPYPWLEGRVDVYDPDRTQGGWTLTNILSTPTSGPLLVVMYDMQGRVVWYDAPPDMTARLDVVATLLDGQNILIGPGVTQGESPVMVDLTGRVLWTGPEQPTQGIDGTLHHVLARLSNGHVITVAGQERNIPDVGRLLGDRLIELDADNEPVWTWDAFAHMDEIPYDPEELEAGGWWLYINSATVDLDADAVYFSAWDAGLAIKVDRASGRVLWILGEGGDFSPDPEATHPWFGALHAFEPLGGDRYLLYDNGSLARGYSRAVLYRLDEQTMQATIEWAYAGAGAEDTWFNTSGGDVDRLDNGNFLILAGNGAQSASPSRMIEVTPEGDKVWQMWLQHDDPGLGAYQVQRIPPMAEPL